MEDLMKGILNKALTLGLLMSVIPANAMESKAAAEIVAPVATEVAKPAFYKRAASWIAGTAKAGKDKFVSACGSVAEYVKANPKKSIAAGLVVGTAATVSGVMLYKSSKAAAREANTLKKIEDKVDALFPKTKQEIVQEIAQAKAARMTKTLQKLEKVDPIAPNTVQAAKAKKQAANIQAKANAAQVILTKLETAKASFDKTGKAVAFAADKDVQGALSQLESAHQNRTAFLQFSKNVSTFEQAMLATRGNVKEYVNAAYKSLKGSCKGLISNATPVAQAKPTAANTTNVVATKAEDKTAEQPGFLARHYGKITTGALVAGLGFAAYKYGINPLKWFVSKK